MIYIRTIAILMLFNIPVLLPLANAEDDSQNKVQVDRYGFEKADQSDEQNRLIDKFTTEKSQMDNAIANTKTLIQKSQGKIYLPELYLRLAELYIEKSRIVYFLRRTQSGASIKSAMESLESNALKIQAIETYQRIINQYPDFKDMDKVHFYLAHEYRELARLKEMRAQYLTLIKKYPKSKLVAESHLLLSDYYTDIKRLSSAKKHLKAVLKYPRSAAIGIAQYKLAWVHISNKEYKQALTLLERSVKGPTAGEEVDIDTYGRVDIRSEAFNDMAFIYSNYYKKATPQQALSYFKKYSWSRQSYILVLEKLAYRYIVKKKWSHAGLIYRRLAKLNNQPNKLLEYVDNIYHTVKELKSYQHAHEDVTVIVKALTGIKYSIHVKQDVKNKAMEDYEIFARDVTTRLHATAKKKSSVEDFSLSADAYDIYLGFFDDNIYQHQMKTNYAESLFNAKRFPEAGKVYESLAGEASNDGDKKKFLYSATLSFYEALKDRQKLNYYQTVQAQSGLAQTGEAYVAQFPNSNEVSNVLFNIAWIRYDEGKFDQAIEQFSRFITQYPGGQSAKAAVKLILDAYSIKEDYQGLIEFGKTVAANPHLSKAIKTGVAQIASSAQSKMVSNLTVASIDDWEAGKERLLAFAQKHQSSSMGAQTLNALFISSKEKNDLQTMQSTGQNIIANYPKSQDADSVLKAMIEASMASSQYRVLAENLEVYAKQFSKTATAQSFLLQAAHIRQTMDQVEIANRHYRTLLSQYPLSKSDRLAYSQAIAHNEQGNDNPRGAIQVLARQTAKLDREGAVEVNASLAVLYQQIAQPKRANQHFNLAQKAFNSGVGASNAAIKNLLSQQIYNQAQGSLEQFNLTQLQDVLDESVVGSKTALFQDLQTRYYAIMDLASAKWSLLASYRLYEINNEFASFLQSAPLPELSASEQVQYRDIIAQKVAQYRAEGEEYLLAGQQLAERLKSFDPVMSDYESSVAANNDSVTLFSAKPMGEKIGLEAFDDDELRELHNRVSHSPKDNDTLMALALAYYQRGDSGQANIIAKSLTERDPQNTELVARVNYLQGIIAIEFGHDQSARERLQAALQLDPGHENAKAKLTALLNHYGYQ